MACRAWVKAEALTWNGSQGPRGSCWDRFGAGCRPVRASGVPADLVLLRSELGSQAGSLRINFRAKVKTEAKLRDGCTAHAMASQTKTNRAKGPAPRATPARSAACSRTCWVKKGANGRKSRCRIWSHTECLV
jgi:hypothetical protein